MLYTLDLFGTIVFAASGALLARERQQTWFVAASYALLTALGGGTIRDLLLHRTPVFWIQTPAYLWLAGITGIFILGFTKFSPLRREQLYLLDTFSMAVFTVVGVQVILSPASVAPTFFSHWAMVPLMGLLTAVGGGIVRDLLSSRRPCVIQDPGYVIASLAGGIVYSSCVSAHVANALAISLAISAIMGFRLFFSHNRRQIANSASNARNSCSPTSISCSPLTPN